MLTENEREWLNDRKNKAFCRYCEHLDLCHNIFAIKPPCPLDGSKFSIHFKDAAEFSERVAAKLANYIETLGWKGCGEHALKLALLQVEEEMDA